MKLSKSIETKLEIYLKVSKQTHYKTYLEENKNNCKAIWDGIHEIIYSKKKNGSFSPSSLHINGQTITDKFSIAENFNYFVILIGKKYNIKSIQRKEITPIILDVPTQIPSSHHQPHLMK